MYICDAQKYRKELDGVHYGVNEGIKCHLKLYVEISYTYWYTQQSTCARIRVYVSFMELKVFWMWNGGE